MHLAYVRRFGSVCQGIVGNNLRKNPGGVAFGPICDDAGDADDDEVDIEDDVCVGV